MSQKVISIRQPVYLPALVYFDLLLQSDIHVIYDNVQYERRHYGNRNRIRNSSHPQGWQWLSIPIIQKGKVNQLYSETQIDNKIPWAKQHWKAIISNYSKTPYFKKYSAFFEDIYKKEWNRLVDLNFAITKFILNELEINTKIVLASQLKTKRNFKNKNDRLIEIVRELKGTTYLTVMGTKDYIDSKKFRQQNTNLVWHNFSHPKYKQLHGQFVPWMSSIDLLFNHGKKSINLIKKNKKRPLKSPI